MRVCSPSDDLGAVPRRDPARESASRGKPVWIRLMDFFIRSRFSIAIYSGADPLRLAPIAPRRGPVLTHHDVTDGTAQFVADPFMVRVDQAWHMFFETVVLTGRRRTGVISHATSQDGVTWQYQRVVLSEPFHLSYPHVFRWGADFYMVPESSAAGEVRLYRADPFPSRWVFEAVLVRGPVLLDTTVFRHEDRWWMLTATTAASDTLALFHSTSLTGPWTEHRQSPVVRGDPHRARPAGRVIALGGRLVRFAQDCAPRYATGVRALEITRLSVQEYEQREIDPVLVFGPGTGLWNRRGMHHVDAQRLDDGRWIACVDGWYSGIVGMDELRHEWRARGS
jgi:hypothetical protein